MKKLALVTMAVAALSLSACADGGTGPGGWGTKQTIGTGVGAVGGGLLGSQIGHGTGRLWATGAGVLLGGLIGNSIGSSLDNADRAQAARAQERAYAAPIGQPISWNNPQSGNSGTFTPVRDGTAANGQYCREYQSTVVIGGQAKQAYGTACRQPDGQWQIVSQ
jgi:surface antigen